MRGLILLCLAGYILGAVLTNAQTTKNPLWKPGSRGGLNGTMANSTTNSTLNITATEGGRQNVVRVPLPSGTRMSGQNPVGFGPPPADGEDTQGKTKD